MDFKEFLKQNGADVLPQEGRKNTVYIQIEGDVSESDYIPGLTIVTDWDPSDREDLAAILEVFRTPGWERYLTADDDTAIQILPEPVKTAFQRAWRRLRMPMKVDGGKSKSISGICAEWFDDEARAHVLDFSIAWDA